MPILRFSTDVPQQLYTDIQTLNAFSEELLQELVGLLLSFLAAEGLSQVQIIIVGSNDIMETLTQYAQSHGINFNALKNTVRGILYFFKGSIRNNLTPAVLKEDMITLGLSDEKAGIHTK